jgi:pyruvate dehydrogenase E2 component (dihydrolipoamide acetyltransferase)
MELVARGDGVLRKRLINEGDTAPVGTLAGVIATADENIDALIAGAAPAPAAGAPAPAQVVATTQESAGASSVPRKPSESQGEASTPPQQKIADVPAAPVAREAGPPPGPGPSSAPATGDVRSSPLARRLASERGLDLHSVQGSGPNGRIIKRDIEAAAAAGVAVQRPAAAAAPSGPVIPREGDFHDEPLTNIRKTIAKRLGESIGPIPTFYLTAEFDLSRVQEMRAAMKDLGDEYKVSVNDVLLKATAVALSQHPEINAHWLGDRIRYHNRVHLGMAVATNDGLIVPVIWDADRKRMSEISAESKELAKRARDRKLKPEEFTGSTFSVSNLGMFGIDQFTAIINPPEAAILAIGTSEDKLVVVNGEPVVRNRVRVTMSCDHRIIDGAVGAKFLQTLRRLVENPLMLVY